MHNLHASNTPSIRELTDWEKLCVIWAQRTYHTNRFAYRVNAKSLGILFYLYGNWNACIRPADNYQARRMREQVPQDYLERFNRIQFEILPGRT